MGSLQSRFEADQNHWASSNLHDFFQRLLLWLKRVAFPYVLACRQGISSVEKHVGSNWMSPVSKFKRLLALYWGPGLLLTHYMWEQGLI
jgi:hypothetical protein